MVGCKDFKIWTCKSAVEITVKAASHRGVEKSFRYSRFDERLTKRRFNLQPGH